MKKDDAIKKITKECEGKDHLIPFEEYLTSICTNDIIAEKILNPEKTLEGAFNAMKKNAQKRQVNGSAYIPPEEGFKIIRDYYGIELSEDPAAPEVVDVLDLL